MCGVLEYKNLSWCDGHRFLLRGPAAFPCQSFGVCKTCRPLHYYRGTKSYFCPRCLAEPATVENLYGFNITTPRDNTKMLLPEKNVVLPAGAPVLKYGTEWNPAKVFLDARTAREAKGYVSTLENKRQELSFILKSAFTTASISQGQERIWLKALSELQARGLATFQGVLAKKTRTLKKWADQGDENSFASNAKVFNIDAAGFLQGQSEVPVITLNPLDLIQAVLLKPELQNCITLTDGIDQYLTKPWKRSASGKKVGVEAGGKQSP